MTFEWRGIVRPDRPLTAADTRPVRRLPDTDNRVACRERYADLRRNGMCVTCKADSPTRAKCLACRRRSA